MKRMMTLTVVTLSMLLSLPAFAQWGGRGGGQGFGRGGGQGFGRGGGPGFGRGGGPAGQNVEMMKEFRGKMLRDVVGLDEARAVQVEAVLDELRPQRQELHRQMAESMQTLHELVRNDSNDQKAYQATLDALQVTHLALQDLRNEEMATLQKILTPKEQAKLFIAHKRFRNQGQQFMRGSGQGRGRGGMGRGMRTGPQDGSGPNWWGDCPWQNNTP